MHISPTESMKHGLQFLKMLPSWCSEQKLRKQTLKAKRFLIFDIAQSQMLFHEIFKYGSH